MIKNDWSYDLYDSDNGWDMGLGAKNQKDGDVCALEEIFKNEEEEEEEEEEIKAADELMKKLNEFFTK